MIFVLYLFVFVLAR